MTLQAPTNPDSEYLQALVEPTCGHPHESVPSFSKIRSNNSSFLIWDPISLPPLPSYRTRDNLQTAGSVSSSVKGIHWIVGRIK